MSKPIVVVAFGDSTTAPREGVTVYPELLQRHFSEGHRPMQMINAGVRGDHTERARDRFVADVLAHEPQIVILRFGINDAAVDVWDSPPAVEPRVSLSRFRDNLLWMAMTLREQGAIPILCTPNPLAWSDVTLRLYGQPPYLPEDADGFNVLLRDYVAAIRELAVQLGVPLVDLDAAFRHVPSQAVPSWQDLLLDGMHPNDAGHRLATKLLAPILEQTLGSLISVSYQ
jgi:lysophospholipase L1-like esterase